MKISSTGWNLIEGFSGGTSNVFIGDDAREVRSTELLDSQLGEFKHNTVIKLEGDYDVENVFEVIKYLVPKHRAVAIVSDLSMAEFEKEFGAKCAEVGEVDVPLDNAQDYLSFMTMNTLGILGTVAIMAGGELYMLVNDID